MIAVDTSAIIAILFGEPENDDLRRVLASETALAISAVSVFETSVVAVAKKRDAGAAVLVDALLNRLAVKIVSVDHVTAQIARSAYCRFGKGFHPARLNFGDCFAYALAKARSIPLLHKGDDFAQTDVSPAWRP